MTSLGTLRDSLSLPWEGEREHLWAPGQPRRGSKKPPGAFFQHAAGSCGRVPVLPGAFPWERLGSSVLGGCSIYFYGFYHHGTYLL